MVLKSKFNDPIENNFYYKQGFNKISMTDFGLKDPDKPYTIKQYEDNQYAYYRGLKDRQAKDWNELLHPDKKNIFDK